MNVSSSRLVHNLDIPKSVTIGSASVPFSSSVKNLGVYLDEHLDMKTQVKHLIQSANYELRRINSIRRFLTTEATATLVCALVLSRLDYCNSLLFNCGENLLDKLQRVQNNAVRLIFRMSYQSHISPYLNQLHWLPIRSRIQYKLSTICYKCISQTAPLYLQDLLSHKSHSKRTRSSSDTSALQEGPASSQKTFGDRSFSYAAPSVWNNLPLELRQADSLASFKSGLKTHLFGQPH